MYVFLNASSFRLDIRNLGSIICIFCYLRVGLFHFVLHSLVGKMLEFVFGAS